VRLTRRRPALGHTHDGAAGRVRRSRRALRRALAPAGYRTRTARPVVS
jgi:hypothetical protein